MELGISKRKAMCTSTDISIKYTLVKYLFMSYDNNVMYGLCLFTIKNICSPEYACSSTVNVHKVRNEYYRRSLKVTLVTPNIKLSLVCE